MSKALIEAIPFPALLIGGDERISAANAPARALFGPGIEDRHYITVLRQPTLLDAVERAMRGGAAVAASYLSTEARRDVTWAATAAPVAGQGGVLVSFEDRTATEEAGQMRRDFVANVSHELRTPLTALSGFIETLKGRAKDDPAARERFLGIMEREAARMNRLIDDLLSLGRVEAQERQRPAAEVDLAAIARGAAEALAPLAAEQGVRLDLAGLAGAARIPGDADQLAQVVANLTENAIKYSGRGAEVRLALERADDHPMIRGPAAILTVTDTGEGIDPLHIPRLTERFYRIDSHRSRELGGTGLGLAIVKHIVNRHRGRLRIESAPGRGSRFSVILPVSQTPLAQS